MVCSLHFEVTTTPRRTGLNVVVVSQYRQLMHPLCLSTRAESSCRALRLVNDTGDWTAPIAVALLEKAPAVSSGDSLVGGCHPLRLSANGKEP
jgi:hypothetical protein